MLFTEIVFAPFVLLTLVALAMSRGRNGVQLGVLLAASYIFYGWWDVRFLALIVFSSALDWAVGAELHGSDSRFRRRLLLTASLVGNLGLLGFFKYAGFFVESLRTGLASLGIEAPLPTLEECLEAYVTLGKLTNPDCRFVGIAVNTQALEPDAGERYVKELTERYGLPASDPVAHGVEAILDNLS